MRKLVAIMICFSMFLGGCGPKYIVRGSEGKPSQIVVSAYTQSGCIEDMNEFARENGFEAKLLKIDSDLGWGIFFWPLYKSYKCTGESLPLAK